MLARFDVAAVQIEQPPERVVGVVEARVDGERLAEEDFGAFDIPRLELFLPFLDERDRIGGRGRFRGRLRG